MTSTLTRRPSGRRLTSGLLAAALLAAGPMTSVAAAAPDDEATTTTTTPDPAPSTSDRAPTEPTVPSSEADGAVTAPGDGSTTPADVTAARPSMIQRDAVVVGATGFKLQYQFIGNVQTSTPTQRSEQQPITPEQFYDWSDAGHRYVQWDYPMPDDGETTVTMTAELYDFGKPTSYTVEYTSRVNRTGGSIAVETTCKILRDGAAVNLDDDSPFTCEGTSAQAATGAVVSIGSVRDLDWATITSQITTKNNGAGPRISLGDGTFSTANQEQRIIMNGAEWYPTELTPREQRALPYATIANGQSLTWSAAQRNGTPQSTPDQRAQASFAYRIYLDGAPTSYWINGFAESYRYLSSESSDASCQIFLGSPDTTGQESQRATPFECSAINNSTWATDGHWRSEWDFEVRMADVDTLHQQRDAIRRGVKEACIPDTGPCIQAVGRPQVHVTDVDNAQTIGTNANLQGGEGKEWKFSTTWSREITDSVEQTFGMTTTAKFEIAGVDFEVEVTSETSYGYDLTKGIEYEFKDESFVPYGSIGSYTRLEAWNVYNGDLYFYGEGDRWYRVTGTTIEVPIEPTIFGGVDPLQGGHIEAKQGIDLGEVRFNCVWDVGKKATILVAHHTVEELNACTVPDGWDDTIPDIEALDKLIEENELDPDLITEVREIQRADTEALQAALEQRASQFQSVGG